MSLPLLFIVPALGALLVLSLPRDWHPSISKTTALLFAVATFGIAVALALGTPWGSGYQYEVDVPWIPAIGASFHVGADGIAIALLGLNALLGVVAVAVTPLDTPRMGRFTGLLLLLEAGMAGVFMALDLVLFYVFWEAMLIPAYFLVGLWGRGRPGTAFKFVLYTLVGSLLMLVAIIAVYFQAGHGSFDVTRLAPLSAPGYYQLVLFAAFFLAFAIKIPLIPFQSWLPDTYASTPAPALVLIAGVMGKAGIYGFLRFGLPLFGNPAADVLGWHLDLLSVGAVLAAASIVYGALAAIAQRDLKRLVAYSSLGHMGFIALGLFALNRAGIDGTVLQMVNHGVIVAALFIVVEAIERRGGTLDTARFAMLARRAPVLAGLFAVTALATLGLPGLNGFIGEFLLLLGAWQRWPVLAVLGGVGVVLASVYMLRGFQRVMQGERPALAGGPAELSDLGAREWMVLAPLCLAMVGLGLYPWPVTQAADPSAQAVLALHGVSNP
ncbi:MAG: complex I subunit 4 family protein [Candidatus Dormibacteria bacterium]